MIPQPRSRPSILVRREDYLKPTVNPETKAGMEWFYKLVLMSYPLQASRIPPTEQFRKQNLLAAWDYFFTHHSQLGDIWQGLCQGVTNYTACSLGIGSMLEEFHPYVAPQLPHPSRSNMPNFGSAMLLHGLQRGPTLQPTGALETLLHNSDVDIQIPCGLLRPPGKALYITFGENGPFDRFGGARIEGAFCFEHTREEGRELTFVFTGLYAPGKAFLGEVSLDIQDESRSVMDALADTTERAAQLISLPPSTSRPSPTQDYVDVFQKRFTPERLGYLAKLFLYMSLPEARIVPRNEWSEAKQRMEKLGPKKQAKLDRKLEALYDRVEVGPERLPEFTGGRGEGSEVSPHWRRGHFRHQPCGPRNQERKLIFVKPMLVRADLLKGEGS